MNIFKFLLLFFLNFLSVPALLAIEFSAANCSKILSSKNNSKSIDDRKVIVTESDLVQSFRKSKSLIYDSQAPRPLGLVMGGHMMSNEFDIFKLPQKLPQRDVFFGIGNNASWDLALRSDAKKLVLFDINYEPLMLQRYFFRALFEVSESPADFYKYLFLKVSQKHYEKNTLKLIEDFDTYEDFAWFDGEVVDPKIQRKELSEELLQKIKEKSTDPEIEKVLEVVKAFQDSYMNNGADLFPNSRGSSYEIVLTLFKNRYFPTQAKGIFGLSEHEKEALYENNLTFLSSSENFYKMKDLMLNASYVVASVESLFWQSFAPRLEGNTNGVTIYSSNILEVYGERMSREKVKNQFVDAFKLLELPVSFIESRGTKYHHDYEVQEIKVD
jgi:hypothetical protein